jgi:hypothetical protein
MTNKGLKGNWWRKQQEQVGTSNFVATHCIKKKRVYNRLKEYVLQALHHQILFLFFSSKNPRTLISIWKRQVRNLASRWLAGTNQNSLFEVPSMLCGTM